MSCVYVCACDSSCVNIFTRIHESSKESEGLIAFLLVHVFRSFKGFIRCSHLHFYVKMN